MSAQKVTYGKSTKLKANAYKRTAYVFTGWNTKKDGKGKAYKDKASVKNLAAKGKTVTLYAQWRKAKTYTVAFDANDGSGATASQKITYNKATALAACGFTREDYAFAGWNAAVDGSGKAYKDKASVTNLAAEGKSVTLYAQWDPTTYQVVFDANGGAGEMGAQKMVAGKTARLLASRLTRDHYRFAGWTTEADGSGEWLADREVVFEDLAPAGGSVTLYAQWDPTAYEVVYDANGGEGTAVSRFVTAGRAFRLLAAGFARAGYHLVGWSSEADGAGEWFEASEIVLDDLAEAGGMKTLYAQWEADRPITYAVAYDANGGEGEMATKDVPCGGIFKLSPVAFVREGWEFCGWNTEADGSGEGFADREVIVDDLAPAGGAVALYAQWREVPAEPEPVTYTVAYDANGGTGEMAAQVVTCGEPFKLAPLAYERENWEFLGWSTAEDGSGETYGNKEVILDDLAAAGGTVTLYAQWRAVTWTIRFDANGGTGQVPDPVICRPIIPGEKSQYSGEFTMFVPNDGSETPVRDGCVFCGWSERPDGFLEGTNTQVWEYGALRQSAWTTSNLVVGETRVLYARWQERRVLNIVGGKDASWNEGTQYVVGKDTPLTIENLSTWSGSSCDGNVPIMNFVEDYLTYDYEGDHRVPLGSTFDELFPDAENGEATVYFQYYML